MRRADKEGSYGLPVDRAGESGDIPATMNLRGPIGTERGFTLQNLSLVTAATVYAIRSFYDYDGNLPGAREERGPGGIGGRRLR